MLKMTPAEVSALSSLLIPGAEIECLSLWKNLPEGAGIEFGEAMHGRLVRCLWAATASGKSGSRTDPIGCGLC
ncbi:MAG: hypothetical protein P4L69_24230 [Desulfosporosinus sp.]|nr:hypothetical protein [Desulfosporosinus sp.]